MWCVQGVARGVQDGKTQQKKGKRHAAVRGKEVVWRILVAARGVQGGKTQQEKVLVTSVWNALSLLLRHTVACYDVKHDKNTLKCID